MKDVTIHAVLHGESGSGKSFLAGTAPAPKLILDCEGGGKLVRSNRPFVTWDPLTELAPTWDGTWQSCIVNVLDWRTLNAAYDHLRSGKHQFRSVILDSLTEAQKRLVDNVAGTEQPSLPQWGTIGRHLEDMVRKLRDLTMMDNTIEVVVCVCLSNKRDGFTRPNLRGQIEMTLPQYYDVVGYVNVMPATDEDNIGQLDHHVLLVPHDNIIAKDRSGELVDTLGPNPKNASISEWLVILNNALAGSN